MDTLTTDAMTGSEETFSDSFICSICLDLMFKPIVLSCGHISCFWCVYKSMNKGGESFCPICRQSYNYFPTICEMLHNLLIKLYPLAYKRREEQIHLEEKESGYCSPQFNSTACVSPNNQECNYLKDHQNSSTCGLESDSLSEPCSTRKGETKGNHKPLTITDVQCNACKELLFRPVFLNCGHGYCETCISHPVDDILRCKLCDALHPTGVPKVSLDIHHFLEEQFPVEYAMKRDAVKLNQVNMKIDNPTGCSARATKRGFPFCTMLKEELSRPKVHTGVGCDFCGMYPIIGDRYKCKDCVEAIGFDLCGHCYETRSKRPGRFNQRHTQEHRLERVQPSIRKLILGVLTVPLPSIDAEEATGNTSSDPTIRQNET